MLRRSKRPPCPESHDRYGALAEELQRQIGEAARSGNDPETVINAILNQLKTAGRDKLIVQTLLALPAVERWARLAALFSDDVFRTALENERERLAAEQDPRRKVALLARKARQAGKLDLSRIPAETRLVVELYKPDVIEASRGHKRPLLAKDSLRTLRLEALGEGEFRVLSDVCDRSAYTGPYSAPDHHATISLGSYLPEEEDIDSWLYQGSEIRYSWDGEVSDFDLRTSEGGFQCLWVGRVALDGVEVFSDPV